MCLPEALLWLRDRSWKTVTTHLYLAPAGGGKTAYLIDLARQAAGDLGLRRRSLGPRGRDGGSRGRGAGPRVIVPTRLQVRMWRERLAQTGGALGVTIGTFDDVYREVLRASGRRVTRLVDAVQLRLLRSLVGEAPLTYYDRIRALPGFVQALRDLISELKAGGVFPDRFVAAVQEMRAGPRLEELAQLYDAYQRRVQQEDWADYAGVGWLAEEDLVAHPGIAADWPCVLVDGFDDLTTVQVWVLARLAERVGQMVITLTGTAEGVERLPVHKRSSSTPASSWSTNWALWRKPLPGALDVTGRALPLAHLERTLYAGVGDRMPAPNGSVTLAAVPDREAEVRTALRWVKARIVRDGLRPGETAILARSLEPYRAHLQQVGAEYGLPVRVAGGQPLRGNPAIAALLDLLSLTIAGDGHFAWRPTVQAWRSPYFDWAPLGITPQDAAALEAVARWGSVVGGPAQWEEAFALLQAAVPPSVDREEEGAPIAGAGLTTLEAGALWAAFRRFCRCITPPESALPYRDFVIWLEQLIGGSEAEPETDDAGNPRKVQKPCEGAEAEGEGVTLGLAWRAEAPEAGGAVARDRAALEALKDVLRGLVWAEEALAGPPVTFATFLEDLIGAIDAATYQLPLATDADIILAAEVAQARGLGFRAVAVLGLAEGEFPTALSEDPFLRDADRVRLRDGFGLPIDRSPENLEAQIFYEAITRPRDALLLTRPRIADNGALWEPSPFWEEVLRRLAVTPLETTSRSFPAPDEAASWPELLAAIVPSAASIAQPGTGGAWAWAGQHAPVLCERIAHGQAVLAARLADIGLAGSRGEGALHQGSPLDGDLTGWAATFAERFGPHQLWSASRLEQYRACPYWFFTSSVLRLEPLQPPSEGLDARQLGNIYHHILEQLYRAVGPEGDGEALLAALPEIAAAVLDAAPREEQFRETAYWQRTREQILAHVEQSVRALAALGGGYRFSEAERTFGIAGQPGPALVVHDGGDSFSVHGYIDRVDRDDAGHVRIVDYKTAGPSTFTNAAVRDCKKLQLPLYALAAQEALGLGQVTEGFYWHVQHAEPGGFTLSGFSAGDERASGRDGARRGAGLGGSARRARGAFVPRVPAGGCPSYCPAAAYCWHYRGPSW